MEFLLTYDVDTTTLDGRRRLRRVAKTCEGYGLRVQQSVFEIICAHTEWIRLQHRLTAIIDTEIDSIRTYPLPQGTFTEAHHLGHAPPAPHDTPLLY